MTRQERIENFNTWMLKIGNIYYSNNELMLKAFNKIK